MGFREPFEKIRAHTPIISADHEETRLVQLPSRKRNKKSAHFRHSNGDYGLTGSSLGECHVVELCPMEKWNVMKSILWCSWSTQSGVIRKHMADIVGKSLPHFHLFGLVAAEYGRRCWRIPRHFNTLWLCKNHYPTSVLSQNESRLKPGDKQSAPKKYLKWTTKEETIDWDSKLQSLQFERLENFWDKNTKISRRGTYYGTLLS